MRREGIDDDAPPRAGRLKRLGAVLTVALALPMGARAAAADAEAPQPAMALPEFHFAGVPEPYGAVAPWECSPVMRAGTRAFGDMLVAASGARYTYQDVRPCNAGWGVARSQHKTGRAIDLMVDSRDPQGRVDGLELLAWLFEAVDGVPHARLRRLGIVEIIWDARMWTTAEAAHITTPDPATWRPYTGLGCAGDPLGQATECHFDHFHFTLSAAGAEGMVTFNDPAARVESPAAVRVAPASPDPLVETWRAGGDRARSALSPDPPMVPDPGPEGG